MGGGVKGEGLIWVGHDKWSQSLVGEELVNGVGHSHKWSKRWS